MSDRNPIPVLEIGGTHASAALVDPVDWRIVDGPHRSGVRGQGSREEIVDDVLRAGATLIPPRGARWGVAIPGPFDYAAGIAEFHGVGKFDALRGAALGQILTEGLPGDAAGTVFLNDAHAFGLGEWRAGATRGHEQVLAITIGTGVGSCFLDGGRVVQAGPAVPPQGRVDLLRIDGGPLEGSVSRRAILARFTHSTGRSAPPPDVREIAERAREGDRVCHQVFADTMHTLGRALAPWTRWFGASLLIVGGSIAASWDLLADPLRAGLEDADEAHAAPAMAPASSAHPALIGAAWWAHESRAGRGDPP